MSSGQEVGAPRSRRREPVEPFSCSVIHAAPSRPRPAPLAARRRGRRTAPSLSTALSRGRPPRPGATQADEAAARWRYWAGVQA